MLAGVRRLRIWASFAAKGIAHAPTFQSKSMLDTLSLLGELPSSEMLQLPQLLLHSESAELGDQDDVRELVVEVLEEWSLLFIAEPRTAPLSEPPAR